MVIQNDSNIKRHRIWTYCVNLVSRHQVIEIEIEICLGHHFKKVPRFVDPNYLALHQFV